MGIVRITEEDVKKNVRNYRIKQTFFVLGVMAVSVIIIVSLIVYYNIKQRALVGALYLSDENSAVQLVYNLMYLNINKYTLQAGSDAMLECANFVLLAMTATYFIEKVIISFAVPFTIISVIFGIVSPQTIAGIEYTVAGVVSRILLFGITALILYFATKRGASVVKSTEEALYIVQQNAKLANT